MKKSIVLIISLLAIAVIASSTFSWAHRQGRSGHSGMSHGECVNHAGKKLSQEQREQLSALRHRFTDETVETRTAIANLYNEINMKMKTSGPDRNELVSNGNCPGNLDNSPAK